MAICLDKVLHFNEGANKILYFVRWGECGEDDLKEFIRFLLNVTIDDKHATGSNFTEIRKSYMRCKIDGLVNAIWDFTVKHASALRDERKVPTVCSLAEAHSCKTPKVANGCKKKNEGWSCEDIANVAVLVIILLNGSRKEDFLGALNTVRAMPTVGNLKSFYEIVLRFSFFELKLNSVNYTLNALSMMFDNDSDFNLTCGGGQQKFIDDIQKWFCNERGVPFKRTRKRKNTPEINNDIVTEDMLPQQESGLPQASTDLYLQDNHHRVDAQELDVLQAVLNDLESDDSISFIDRQNAVAGHKPKPYETKMQAKQTANKRQKVLNRMVPSPSNNTGNGGSVMTEEEFQSFLRELENDDMFEGFNPQGNENTSCDVLHK